MRDRARNCPLCSCRLSDEPGRPDSKHLDHIIPVSQGGTHTHGNTRITCATCNLRRPKNGSDYEGPVTLWAQGPAPVSRPDQRHNRGLCGKGLHPWIPENIAVTAASGKKYCAPCRNLNELGRRAMTDIECSQCHAPFTALSDRQAMCGPCTETAGCRAAELHASGLPWAEVAKLTGYRSGEGARYAAKRAGYVPSPERLASGRLAQRDRARESRQARVIRPAEISGILAGPRQPGNTAASTDSGTAPLPAGHVPLYDPSVSLSVIARQIMRQDKERSAAVA
jgi:HNH endonuclease